MRLKTNFRNLLLPIVLASILWTPVKAAVPQLAVGIILGNTDGETAGAVSVWQEYLIQGGYLKIKKPTGVFGPLTGQATERWQKDHGITSTAPAVGPKVRVILKELSAQEKLPVKNLPPSAPTPVLESSEEITIVSQTPVVVPETCIERKVPEDYPTINAALHAACPADLILVNAGTYEEGIINITQPVTIQGVQGRDKTIIRAARGPALFISTPTSGVVIDGLTLIGAASQPAALINISPRLLASPLGLVIRNSTLKSSETGLSINAPLGEITVERTIVANNRSIGISDNFGGTLNLKNNTIVKNDVGYSLEHQAGKHILTNNILAQNTTDGVSVGYLGREIDLDMNYNNVANNDKNNYYTYRDASVFVPRGLGNVGYNPGFISTDDYRLTSTSKLIDAGDPKSTLDEDGTRVDIGALSFDQRTLKNSQAFFMTGVKNLLASLVSWMW